METALGFGKPTTAPTAATLTGANFGGAVAFSASTGSYLNVSDGITSASLSVDSNSLKSDGTALGTGNLAAADVADAYNVQLAASGSSIRAEISGSAIAFKSADLGSTAVVDVKIRAASVDTGFGTAVGNATGTAVAGAAGSGGITGLSALGADASDGSAKAIITGSIAVPNTNDYTTTPKDSSFTIKLGDNQAKKITLNSSNLDATATPAEIVAAINTQFKADTGLSGKVEASLDSAGKLQINSTAIGADQKITINAAQTTILANQIDIGFGQAAATIKPAVRTAVGVNSSGSTNSTRTSLSKQFNELLNQITQQAKDSSYNGINLLYRSGDDAKENSLKVTFNETGSSSITISGSKLDSDGLGLTAVTGGFQNDDEINKTLTAITAATSQLRAQASTFGSNLSVVQNRQDFSKNLINILDTGSANLTNADLNEEAANSQALSTRQSLGISALSLANQANQGILQLLR
ncbi:flagellin [Methylobacterium sp. 37f]|uniref:flagellin n=1 Tax=Methylobacterium sp. 37f TaxID=2817058 RepID=UPI001FFD9541|nr:hypothetical protein [Methylobacterium sp. 37f]